MKKEIAFSGGRSFVDGDFRRHRLGMRGRTMISVAKKFEDACNKAETYSAVSRAGVICEASRWGHIRVWCERPSKDEVKEFLAALRGRVETLPDEPLVIQVYRRKMEVRIKSLEAYLQDRDPVFPAGADEEEKRILQDAIELAKQHPPLSAKFLPDDAS